MNSTELKDKFRLEAYDTVAPYLWSDAEIYEYMDDAQKMFCRLTEGIPDSTSALTQIPFAAGDIFIPYDPLILKIRQAVRASDFKPIAIINFEDIGLTAKADDYRIPVYSALDNSTGEVVQLVLGMEQDQMRLVNIPTVADQINLIVYRLPFTTLTMDGQDLEIHQQHHVHLIKWMKHRGYSKHDAETFNKGKADEFEQAFRQYCVQARVEWETRKHKPRGVVYGGY